MNFSVASYGKMRCSQSPYSPPLLRVVVMDALKHLVSQSFSGRNLEGQAANRHSLAFGAHIPDHYHLITFLQLPLKQLPLMRRQRPFFDVLLRFTSFLSSNTKISFRLFKTRRRSPHLHRERLWWNATTLIAKILASSSRPRS